MTNKFKLLIFDWDGTLSDSVSRIAECMQIAVAEHQLPVPSHQQAANIVGLGLSQAVKSLFPTADNQLVASISHSYSSHYRFKANGPANFFPHVKEVLQQLKDQGYLLAVATGKSHAGLERELLASGLERFFHATRCADKTASKPDPLMLEELLDQFKLSADKAIMVGDTTYDMEMAKNANMPRLAVSYGAHAVERLAAYQPIVCINSFLEIKNHV
jgi:phosphoglycolate phosphatase